MLSGDAVAPGRAAPLSPGGALRSWKRGRRGEARGRGAEVTRALHPAQASSAAGAEGPEEPSAPAGSARGERAEGRAAGPSGARAGARGCAGGARGGRERSRERDGPGSGAPFSAESPAGGPGCQGNHLSRGWVPARRPPDAPPVRGGALTRPHWRAP